MKGVSPRRQVLAVSLLFLSLAAVALALAAMTGSELLLWLGPLRLSARDPLRALALGAAAALALALLGGPGLWRLAGGLLVAMHSVLGLVAAVHDQPQGWPVEDSAVIELYTLHAAEGRQLLGPYSRFGFHHPGPAMFYALLPFYSVSGHHTRSLSAGALAINLLSLALVTWVLLRVRAPLVLVVSLQALLLLLIYRVPELLTSAWNPHLPVLPFIAVLVTGAAVASGDVALLPLTAVLSSFVVQSHVGFAAATMAACGVAVLTAAVRSLLSLDRRRDFTRWLVRAAWVLAVMWALPVAEQLAYRPGNLGRIVAFLLFEGDEGRVAGGAALRAWGDSLMGILNPDFQLPVGWYFRPAQPWLSFGSLGAMLLLPFTAIAGWRLGLRLQAGLATVALAGGLAGLWSVRSIRFEIFDHAVFWLGALGLVALASLVSTWIVLIRPARALAVPAVRGRMATIAVGAAVIMFSAVAGWRNLAGPLPPLGSEDGAVQPFVEAITAAMPQYDIQKPLLQVDGQAWGVTAGVLLHFAKAGIPIAVDRRLVDVFDRPWLPTGEEDAVFTIADEEGHARLAGRPDNVPVAAFGGYFVDALVQ